MMKVLSLLVSLMVFMPTAVKVDVTKPTHCLMMRPKLLDADGRSSPLMAQEGNPGHHEPPPGWHCAHGEGDDKDAPCACHRKCVDVPPDEDNNIPEHTEVVEDAKCNSYCFKDHCRCGVENCD
jgi:hypothetical protein